jgi:hypothetical protein
LSGTGSDSLVIESKPAGSVRLGAALGTVLAVTWLNSVATGIAYNGIFFITDQAYKFSKGTNLVYALLLGVTYIVGALGAGPMVRWVRLRTGCSTRAVLLGIVFAAAALYMLPVVAWFALPSGSRLGSAWSAWVFMGLYSALCGTLWPVVESFMSGGRSDAQMRSAVGKFNVCWSSALVFSLLLVAGVPEGIKLIASSSWGVDEFDRKISTLAFGAVLHLLSVFAIAKLPREPGVHVHEAGHAHPPIYHRLLAVHRALLPTSYMVMYALLPALPTAMKSLGFESGWAEVVTTTWLIARIVMFVTMDRWHGWHGTWLPAICGTTGLIVGFGLCVISPMLASHPALGRGMMVVGLALFGLGVAAIYSAALYYAMEVGSAAVDAGGMHEALIGLGYTLGPGIGLAAVGMGAQGVITPESVGGATLGLVGVGAGIGVVFAVAAGYRVRNRL